MRWPAATPRWASWCRPAFPNCEVAIVAAVGLLWFKVPFAGNPLVLVAGTCLFLLSALAIGLLISTICTTQQQAFASNFFVLNPMFILSGFSFPIASMRRRY